MNTVIATIGHSRHAFEYFLALLSDHHIATLVDVRSTPYSKWAPQFSQRPLHSGLDGRGLAYVFLGRELGGRPEGAEFYGAGGRLDYARRALAPDFRAGLDRLHALARDATTAILCAEEDPVNCHRSLLIAPALRERGIAVTHIRGDGRVERDEESRGCQPSLFSHS